MNAEWFVFICKATDPPHPVEVGFAPEEYDECHCGEPLIAVPVAPLLCPKCGDPPQHITCHDPECPTYAKTVA